MHPLYQLSTIARQLDASDLDAVPASERRRIAAELRRAAELAERRGPAAPASGVLGELREYRWPR